MTDSANLDLVRSIYADWERGDFSRADWADAEIEFDWTDGVTRTVSLGLEGMAETVRTGLDAWEEVKIAADEYRELDDERVLVLMHMSGQGRRSGVDLGTIRATGAHLFQLQGHKVQRIAFYWESRHAFADLGLTAPRAE
jgi:hypothetical protein